MKKYSYTDNEMKTKLEAIGYEIDDYNLEEIALIEGYKWNDKERVWYIYG
ncbi:hypothetical protein [Enterococcus casseliflavus]